MNSLKRISKMETKIKRVLTRMVFMAMVATVLALAVPTNVSAQAPTDLYISSMADVEQNSMYDSATRTYLVETENIYVVGNVVLPLDGLVPRNIEFAVTNQLRVESGATISANGGPIEGPWTRAGVGGAITVSAGTVIIDGAISANGGFSRFYDSRAGRGGTVTIDASDVTISGSISANGGPSDHGYAGTGGTVTIDASNAIISGSISASASLARWGHGAMGGTITIDVSDVIISGSISANGGDGYFCTGGAGGTITIAATAATVNGLISANGGRYALMGGTIKVYYLTIIPEDEPITKAHFSAEPDGMITFIKGIAPVFEDDFHDGVIDSSKWAVEGFGKPILVISEHDDMLEMDVQHTGIQWSWYGYAYVTSKMPLWAENGYEVEVGVVDRYIPASHPQHSCVEIRCTDGFHEVTMVSYKAEHWEIVRNDYGPGDILKFKLSGTTMDIYKNGNYFSSVDVSSLSEYRLKFHIHGSTIINWWIHRASGHLEIDYVRSYFVDSDGDGLSDEEEAAGWDITIYDCVGSPVDSYHVTSDPSLADTDGDGLTDLEEKEGWDVRYRVENPNFPPRWIWIEYHLASNPREADVDSDGLSDWQEKVHKTDPSRANTDCDGAWDTNDAFEIDYGLDPLDFDTDDDGLSDGLEIDLWLMAAGYDPEQPELVPTDVLSEAAAQTNNPVIPAFVDIGPDTLNLKSNTKWITAYIELPDGYDVADIDGTTVYLEGVIQAETDPKYDFVTDPAEYLTDKDDDGILERMVKFGGEDLVGVSPGDAVEMVLTGQLNDGTHFIGSDTIRVIDKGGGKK